MTLLETVPPAAVLIGAVVAGFVQGLSGFAVGLVAMSFWSYVLPPQVIAPLITLSSVAGQALTMRAVFGSLDLRLAAPMLAGGIAGVPVGVALLPFVNGVMFKFGVGVLLTAYCPAMLLARSLPQVRFGGRWADAGAGVVGGIMNGIAGLGGPAPTLWCTLRGWERDVQRAMFQSFIIVVQCLTLAGYVISGTIDRPVLALAAWVLPLVLVPSLLGSRLYARLSVRAFQRVVLVLLFLSGLALLAQSGPALLLH